MPLIPVACLITRRKIRDGTRIAAGSTACRACSNSMRVSRLAASSAFIRGVKRTMLSVATVSGRRSFRGPGCLTPLAQVWPTDGRRGKPGGSPVVCRWRRFPADVAGVERIPSHEKVSHRLAIAPQRMPEQRIQGRKYQQREQQRTDNPAHDHGGQRPLHLGADGRRQHHRHKAQGGRG